MLFEITEEQTCIVTYSISAESLAEYERGNFTIESDISNDYIEVKQINIEIIEE